MQKQEKTAVEWLSFYKKALTQMVKTNQAFLFVANGSILDREQCQKNIDYFNQLIK